MRKRDHLANAALAMAIIGTASAEYQLAKDVGWGRMAFALPGALDIYVIRALRAHRDMLAAILAMFAVNAVSHLITVGKLDASVWVVIGVSGIAPAVLWRVHALREAVPAAEAEPSSVPAEPVPYRRTELAEPAPVPVTLERVPETEQQVKQMVQVAPSWPLLGPMTPVAELLAGTGGDQHAPAKLAEAFTRPEPAEPEPLVSEPEAEPSTGSAGVPIERITTVREWLAADPELTGTEIGRRLGTSERYGRRVRTAAMETAS